MNWRTVLLLLLVSLLHTACESSRNAQAADAPAPETAVAERVAPTFAGPKLADEPTIDLLANRHRWHVYGDGLLVTLASEGSRKYSQEYQRPWGPVVEHAGRTSRALGRSRAELTLPWSDGTGPATLRLWAHGGAAGQRVEVRLNGKRVGRVDLPDDWTEQVLAIEADVLVDGENELVLQPSKSATVGGEKTYGLYYALELVPGAAEASGEWPQPSPVQDVAISGEARDAFAGPTKMLLWVEVPATGWLTLDAGALAADAALRVRARTFDGEWATLLDVEPTEGSWQRQQVSLAGYAGRLVALEMTLDRAAVASARIAVEAAPVRERPPAYDNVILLVVDALRADRLALYADTRVKTPRTTAEAKRGVVFKYNQAASPSSPPSHGSIQTGMIPRVHGVAGDKGKLNPGTPMISSVLGKAGIATAYYGNNPFGMARLQKPGNWTEYHYLNGEGKGIDCGAVVTGILDFAERQKAAGKRFFVSSLPYEPHTPYRYHEGISNKLYEGPWKASPVGKSVDGRLLSAIADGRVKLDDDEWAQLKALYDGEVEHWDTCFGELMDGLASRELTASTAVILTSDHGEGMFEHGRMGHAWGHYGELADVPCVIFADGLVEDGPRHVETVTGHVDLAPTVLDLMGVEAPTAIQGESALPLALRQGPWTPRVMSVEYGRSYALRSARYRFIVDYDGTQRLFDLEEDPGEKNDLIGTRPFVLRYFRDLTGFFLEHRSDWKAASWGALNDHRPGALGARP